MSTLHRISGKAGGHDRRRDIRRNIDHASEERDPGEPGDPTLHPGHGALTFRSCETPNPVVLCACYGLDRAHFAEGGDLRENARDDNEEALDNGSGAAVVEDEADVAVKVRGLLNKFGVVVGGVRCQCFPTRHVLQGEEEHLS